MEKQFIEKRKIDRFDISAKAWVGLPDTSGRNRVSDARIINISANGAFLRLRNGEILPNELVDLTVLISVEKLSELFGIDDHMLLEVNGKVLRVGTDGAAIEFFGRRNVNSAGQDFMHGGQGKTH